MVEQDIEAGRLVVLDVDEMPPSGWMLTMSVYHQPSRPQDPLANGSSTT
jgi:hypothetical protein